VNPERKRFLLFVLVGGFSALINVLARVGLSQIMVFGWAVVAAYIIAMLIAYVLNRIFVFEPSGRSVAEEMVKFILVNMVALVQVWAVSVFLKNWALPWIGWTFYPELVAHMAGVASPIFTSYFGHKYFSFGSAPVKPASDSDGS
jgi:putative flippase GtrA